MKKSTKISLIVAVVLILVGAIFSVTAMAMVSFDWTAFNTEHFRETGFTITEDFENIEIKAVDLDVWLTESPNDDCYITTIDSKHIVTEVEVVDNTLKINRVDRRSWHEYVTFGFYEEEINLLICLPKAKYTTLNLMTSGGNVDIPKAFEFENATINTVSGNVDVNELKAERLNIVTVSGNIDLDNGIATKLKIGATSGNIELENTVATETIKIDTTSGDVSFECIDAADYEMHTASGNIEGSIVTPKQFYTSTSSGFIAVPESEDPTGDFVISTTSGDCKITLK